MRTRLLTWGLVVVIMLSSVTMYSKTAHAGLVSFISLLLGSEQASANSSQTSPHSDSQTIGLLQAAANANPNSSFSNIPPVDTDGAILIPDIALADDTSSDNPVNTQVSVYVVTKGDTLSSIAK